MPDERKFDVVHAFVTSSDEAIAWGFWHAAKAIYELAQPGSQLSVLAGLSLAVSTKYGPRDKALLLMYKGRREVLPDTQIEALLGTDPHKEPLSETIVAIGGSQIQRLRDQLLGMGTFDGAGYESGRGIPNKSDMLELQHNLLMKKVEPPAELAPETWGKAIAGKPKGSPPERSLTDIPAPNPALAFSRYANNLLCPLCRNTTVAPEWPRNGDIMPFYAQQQLDRLGAFHIEVTCTSCQKHWFVVWDRDPR